MKTFLILCTFFISIPSFGCPDFSGIFFKDYDENLGTFKMLQRGCESVEFNETGVKYYFDGKDYIIDVEEDSKVYVNNHFEGEKWILQIKTVTPLSNGTFKKSIIIVQRSLNSALDIVDVITYSNGYVETRTTKRVR